MTKIHLNKFGYLILFIIGLFFFYRTYLRLFDWNSSVEEDYSAEVQEWHRDDTEDKFCVWFDFTRRTFESDNNSSITLTTHGSLSHTKYIFEHASRWHGPISVALFVEPNSFIALAAYKRLYHCTPNTKKHVSTHLVWKKSVNTPCHFSYITQFLAILPKIAFPNSCNFNHFEQIFNVPLQTIYPINTLRNIARAGSRTEFHMVSDIENYFSDHAYSNLQKAASNFPDKLAVVVRRFEFAENETLPSSFEMLQGYLKEKKAVQFHLKIYTAGHWIPKLGQWFKYSMNPKKLPIFEPIRYPGPAWEPHLLIRSSYPYHRESFYVRVNDQQPFVYEICRANISFAIASHVFTLHRGIKTHNTKEQIVQRNILREKARISSMAFSEYIKTKYPKTEKQCGKCSKPCGIL